MPTQYRKWIVRSAGALVIIAIGVFIYRAHPPSVATPALATSMLDTSAGIVPTQDVAPGFFQPVAASPADAMPTAPTEPSAAPVGFKKYHSTQYHFSLLYPQDLKITEYDEGSGAHTTVFEKDDNTAFQIFVVPYDESRVSTARFQMDEPSGVMQKPQQITVGGVPATAFFGSNDVMGDTREVWFIRGGYLYEITTYKPLDSWLAGILQSVSI